MNRVCAALVAGLAVVALCAAVSDASAGEDPVAERAGRLASALWQRQHADGGWRSETYAVLKTGQALTPVVLQALMRIPESLAPRPAGSVERAVAFIRAGIDERGAVGMGDPDLLEYPTYATAYALSCLVDRRDPVDLPLIARLTQRLIGSQCQESNGSTPGHPEYGGWGFSAPRAGQPGHIDLAHTRIVLQALRAADALDDACAARALLFLRLVQRHPSETRVQPSFAAADAAIRSDYDGGFYLSPVVLAANKGGGGSPEQPWFSSYATATCDGLAALVAAGVAIDDERVTAAIAWLQRHPRWDWPEGIARGASEPWGESVRFYHLSVRALTARWHMPIAADWSPLLLALGHARTDGLYANPPGFLMKEDDPLVASALALEALAYAVESDDE